MHLREDERAEISCSFYNLGKLARINGQALYFISFESSERVQVRSEKASSDLTAGESSLTSLKGNCASSCSFEKIEKLAPLNRQALYFTYFGLAETVCK